MKFSDLSVKKQKTIQKNFNLPLDISTVDVNSSGTPFVVEDGFRMACQLNVNELADNGFHNHYVSRD